MNAPEPIAAHASSSTNLFVTVPEITLPGGIFVPAFRVGQYACSQREDGMAIVTADGAPWVNINFEEAQATCVEAGFALLTERQWLSMAHNAAMQDCNWTKGKVGEGKLFRGIRKGQVSSAQAGTFQPADAKERRWLTLSNGEKICDLNGNVFQWIADDVQGDDKGLTTTIKIDSLSVGAPFSSMKKGMGWFPDYEADWSGDALIRGGCWGSGSLAGAFRLSVDWPGRRGGNVGFRCTSPLVSDSGSLVAA